MGNIGLLTILGVSLFHAQALHFCTESEDLVKLCKITDHDANTAPSPMPASIYPHIGLLEINGVDPDEKTISLIIDLYMTWTDERISLVANDMERYVLKHH